MYRFSINGIYTPSPFYNIVVIISYDLKTRMFSMERWTLTFQGQKEMEP